MKMSQETALGIEIWKQVKNEKNLWLGLKYGSVVLKITLLFFVSHYIGFSYWLLSPYIYDIHLPRDVLII